MDLATLFEMDWYDKSPLTAVLQRNRGRFVHFSKGAPNRDWQQAKLLPEPEKPGYYDRRTNLKYQRELLRVKRQNAIHLVPKMGINPKSMWRDPKGVYFYPVDWLLTGQERIRNALQLALDYPYYYIVDLNLRDPNGVNLDTLTWDGVAAIAKRNGWFDQMQAFQQKSPEEQHRLLGTYSRPDHPGAFFWHFIDRMVKEDGTLTWSKAYRGISFVRDPNLAIIYNYEPDQVLVLDPRIIKIVEFGENKRPIRAGGGAGGQDSLAQWWHALLNIIKAVRGEFGGDLTWKNKRPFLTFTKGMGNFILTVPEKDEVALNLSYTYGRAYDSLHIGYRDLDPARPEQIVAMIQQRVDRIAARKTDLLFKPIISIAEAKQVMQQQMTNNLAMTIKTTIYNGEGAENLKYSSVALHGEVQHESDRVPMRVTCYLNLRPAVLDGSCNLYIGRHHILAVQGSHLDDYSDTEALFADMATSARKNLDTMMRSFGPRAPGASGTYDRNPRFSTTEELTACIGWMIVNCGLTLGGALVKEFTPEISAFEQYPDRRVLLSDIAYTMNSRF